MPSDTQCLKPREARQHQRTKKPSSLPECYPEVKSLCYFAILVKKKKKKFIPFWMSIFPTLRITNIKDFQQREWTNHLGVGGLGCTVLRARALNLAPMVWLGLCRWGWRASAFIMQAEIRPPVSKGGCRTLHSGLCVMVRSNGVFQKVWKNRHCPSKYDGRLIFNINSHCVDL